MEELPAVSWRVGVLAAALSAAGTGCCDCPLIIVGAPRGPVVLAGGGPEGEIGDTTAWSAALYGELLRQGDVTGDGRVVVEVLSAAEETDWLLQYFEWLGADEANNLQVSDREQANTREVVERLAQADVLFIKGGDQGDYYDAWAGSRLADTVVDRYNLGMSVGGTSAGAMSLGQTVFAGGKDLVSADVLADARTPYLDDTDGGTGLKTYFMPLVQGFLVDTHFTERGRLGRLVGLLAQAEQELSPRTAWGLGIDQQTGVVFEPDRGGFEVFGVGSVALVSLPTVLDNPRRLEGEALVWPRLDLDLLVEGWTWSYTDGVLPLDGATPVDYPTPEAGWAIDGDELDHEERFGVTVDLDPYLTRPGESPPLLAGAVGFVDAHDPEWRAPIQEALFAALRDNPGLTGFLVGSTGALSPQEPDEVVFGAVAGADQPELATIVVDSSGVWAAGSSPWPSAYDAGDGSLHAAGLAGLRLHVLANTAERGLLYDLGSDTVKNTVQP